MTMIRSRIAAVAVTVVAMLSGCATTVVDETATTPAPVISTTTTTTAPPGDLTSTLERMLAEMATLSELVVETTGGVTRERLASIEALWESARAELETLRPEVIGDMERMIDLSRLAVERRRPAEADKAVSFLTPLVQSVIAGL